MYMFVSDPASSFSIFAYSQKYPLNVLIRPRYDHIQEACTQNVTVRALVFSLRDRSSWESAKAMVVNEVYAME